MLKVDWKSDLPRAEFNPYLVRDLTVSLVDGKFEFGRADADLRPVAGRLQRFRRQRLRADE